MIFCKSVNVVVEGVQCTGGDDAGLAPAAAECFAMTPRLANEVGGAAECGADRGAEPF